MIGVYGADGFIGRHLVRRLIAEKRQIRAIARKFRPETLQEFSGHVEIFDADFKQSLEMVASLQGVETVVQFISNSSPGLGNENIVADIKDNVIAHVEFLQSCINVGVKRYIFISSGGTVYGPNAPIPTPENANCDPISSHGISKLSVEKYIQMHGQVNNLEYVILRLANPYGPGQLLKRGHGLIPAILNQHQSGKPVPIYNGGHAKRDYIHIDDVIDAIMASLNLANAPQMVLNIGSGESRSVTEVLDTIETIMEISLDRQQVSGRQTDVFESRLDISKAMSALNWRPKISFEDGLRSYLAKMTKATKDS